MTTDIRVLRSSAPSMRAKASDLQSGQPMANTEASDPGLYFRLDNGQLMKVGPTHIGTSAPNNLPPSGGQGGNAVGETWVDTSNSGFPKLKVYTSTGWLTVSTKGDKGQKGQTGQKGQPGADSTVEGPKGIKGDKGFKGADGAGGGTGSKGIKGNKGEKGVTGGKGVKGPKGNKGVGQKGEPGTNGTKGDKGVPGTSGDMGGTMTSSIIPDTDASYDLGSADNKIRHLYLSDSSVKFGDAELSLGVNEGDLEFGGIPIMPRTLSNVLTTLGVDSYVDQAAALLGGLIEGDVYYNTTDNKLTSVTA